MTDTTQPPAEPLAITGKGFMADGPHAGGFATIVVGGKAYSASEVVAALTRRAGGDAIPAGWQLVPIELPDEMAKAGAKGRQNSAVSSFRDGWKYALAATPKPPAGGDEWSMVNRLRDQEADSVEILCDNPEGDPNNAIVCCGFWTGFAERRFSGDTIADALRSAVEAKDQADRDGHPDVSPAGGDAGAVERLREALQPFLDAAEPIIHDDKDQWHPDEWTTRWKHITVGQFRALYAAALALPAPVVEEDVEKEARFLCDRLAEFEREITDDDQFTQFNGHVAPSAARLRAALSEGRSHG